MKIRIKTSNFGGILLCDNFDVMIKSIRIFNNKKENVENFFQFNF